MAGYKEHANVFEEQWRRYWREHRVHHTPNPGEPGFDPTKPKYVVLDFFPYPSGVGLHIGHPLGYIATDVVSRFRRMRGFNVLHAMGFDAFGLPAEQYAIQTGQHPRVTTEANISNMLHQLATMGFDHDRERQFSTHEPEYYKWTQWIFLQLYHSFYDPTSVWVGPDGHETVGRALPIAQLREKLTTREWLVDESGTPVPAALLNDDARAGAVARGFRQEHLGALEDRVRLAYLAEVAVNWCPQLGTVLSDEEVTRDGRSERGNFPVFRRPLRQWMLRISTYADRLIDDLDDLDWPAGIKEMQRNWIGRSEGALIEFPASGRSGETTIPVYTTRPDTMFGATFMVLAPEHPLVDVLTTDEQRDAVRSYRARQSATQDRTDDEPTGVFTGAFATNPATGEAIPVWIASYIVMGYGTGGIMAVPAHDERDRRFAKAHGLLSRVVVVPDAEWLRQFAPASDSSSTTDALRETYLRTGGMSFSEAFAADGVAIQSSAETIDINGLTTPDARRTIIAWLESTHRGRGRTTYRLRDWLFSRQRYWGEPFPIVFDAETGQTFPLAESELPVVLPDLQDFSPRASDDPDAPVEPPLARATEWADVWGVVDDGVVKLVPSPAAASHARRFKRELNTMPNWAGSCWYYLRYCDPRNDRAFVGTSAERYWMSPGTPGSEARAGGVDLYVGGAEHAVLHLLYARFWHKVLYDLGQVSTREPFQKLFNQGMITADAYRDARGFYVDVHDVELRDVDGETVPYDRNTRERLTVDPGKMGKRYKNGVPPEEVAGEYTVDVFRLYEMYMGPLDATKPWQARAIIGMQRFLSAVWHLGRRPLQDDQASCDPEVDRLVHKTIKRVTEDIERLGMNTALAAMIELTNRLSRSEVVYKPHARALILMLAPFAPHLSEQLFGELYPDEQRRLVSIANASWPGYDNEKTIDASIVVPVTVNGKKKTTLTVSADVSDAALRDEALSNPAVVRTLGDKEPARIVIARRSNTLLVNIVTN